MKPSARIVYKPLAVILCGSGFVLTAWFFLSWADVVMHNLDPSPMYHVWNMFNMFR